MPCFSFYLLLLIFSDTYKVEWTTKNSVGQQKKKNKKTSNTKAAHEAKKRTTAHNDHQVTGRTWEARDART